MRNFNWLPTVIVFIVLFSSTALYGQPGKAEHDMLRMKVGKWQVKMVIQPKADGPKILVDSLMANRELIGNYCLHEEMYPKLNTVEKGFKRLSDLAFNVNENRWDYISIDTRITAGIMYFTFLDQKDGAITSFISSFPHPGFGENLAERGKSVFMRNVIKRIDDDHDQVLQYWRLTDQQEWLAVQYDYRRTK